MNTTKIRLTELVEDFCLYPRADVDSTHVGHIVDALEAGAILPPPIIDAKSKRIVDGFHRCRAWRRFAGKDAEIEVVLKSYRSEAEMFVEAMELNSDHGRNLSSYDRTVAIERAMKLEIDPDRIAKALHMKVERVEAFKTERCAKLENSRRVVPLKMPVRHMLGQTLTREQEDAIKGLGGNTTMFLVNQLLSMLGNGLIDMDNAALLAKLVELEDALARFNRKANAA